MPKTHVADLIADEVLEWLDRTAEAVAEALLGSPFAPQVEQPSQAERLAYFREQFFNPDGTPNLPGRDAVLQTHGPEQYETIALALSKEG